ncbi:hypothetical protein OIU78_000837 [Salix suchowensis]|nr:hypothetical protein OIU78_000837 [Salix suchowensis]
MLTRRYNLKGSDFNNLKTHCLSNSSSLNCLLDDWRKDPNVDFFRALVRNNIVEILDKDRNYQLQLHGWDYVNVLENQLFFKAVSEEEYINLDTLRNRLKSLILHQYDEANCGQQGSGLMVMQTLCSSDEGNPIFNSYPNSGNNNYNPMATEKQDHFGFQKGLFNNEYNPGTTSMYNAFTVTSKQIANEMDSSPDINSSITTISSGDGFPETGTFDSGPFFSQGDHPYHHEAFEDIFQQQQFDQSKLNLVKLGSLTENENHYGTPLSTLGERLEYSNSILQIPDYSGVASILPSSSTRFGITNSTPDKLLESRAQVLEQNQQQSCQLYGQFNKALEVKVPSHFRDQNKFCRPISGHTSMHSQLPSEQSHEVHVPLESSAPFFSSEATILANLNNLPFFSSREKVFAAYVNSKRSTVPMGDCLDSFLKHFHSTVCDNSKCYCESLHLLLLHFDNCLQTDCLVCAPSRILCKTDNLGQNSKELKNGHKREIIDTDSSGYGSCCSGDKMPPSKCQKMEKYSYDFSSGDGIASMVAPFLVQPDGLRGPLALKQLPESPVSISSEFLGVNNDLLMNSMENPTSSDQIRSKAANSYPRLICESVSAPFKEHIVGYSSGEMDSRSSSGVADVMKDDCNQLMNNRMPIVSEEVSAAFNKEAIQVISKFHLAKPAIEHELNATAVKHEEGMQLESPKMRGASLIDFFTPEQIEEHLSSLGQSMCQRISNEEDKIINHINENRCQLCAEDKLWFAPVPVYCSCCGARIKRGVIYYTTSDESGTRPCFCTLCFKRSRGGRITFYGITIPKEKLHKRKNDEATDEPWVECDKCKRWQHQICALFNNKRDMEGKTEYICPKCCLKEMKSEEYMPSTRAAIFGAKDLPRTILSDFIEERLFRHLSQEREERAKFMGMNIDEVPEAEDLAVRVVLSVNKQLKVKEKFLEIFHGENYPAEFPYRSKVILLFQRIEGVDVCLFGLYVQEFGSECSQPNQRSVYISYLDSVKYFRPGTETSTGEALRTFVYHEILIGYLEYCKKRGFATCYLWACPPIKGEDYILYCHPENQKTPKSDKLRQWYHLMLRKAAKENIVVNFTNLYDHFFVPTGQFYSKITAARLPYFDGCYWYDAAEDILKNIEQQTGVYAERKVKKVMTKRTLKAMGHTESSGGNTKAILVTNHLRGGPMCGRKEDFMVVHLQHVCTHCHEVMLSGSRWFCQQCKNFQLCERCHVVERSLNGEDSHSLNNKEKHSLFKVMVKGIPSDTEDNDAILENWHFDNRHTFLGICQKNHYQFDTLRRAKHSSMMILHNLHNPTLPAAGTMCKICHQDTDTLDRDVCAACYHKKNSSLHVYKLNQCSPAANYGTEKVDAHQEALQLKEQDHTKLMAQQRKELLNLLMHATLCRTTSSDPCSNPKCLQMKRLFGHARKCSIRSSGGCQQCQKVWYILKLHAGICRQTDCCVPRCKDLKNYLELQAGKPSGK